MEVKIPVGATASIGLPHVGSGELTTNCSEYSTQKMGQTYWIHVCRVGDLHIYFKIEVKQNCLFSFENRLFSF